MQFEWMWVQIGALLLLCLVLFSMVAPILL